MNFWYLNHQARGNLLEQPQKPHAHGCAGALLLTCRRGSRMWLRGCREPGFRASASSTPTKPAVPSRLRKETEYWIRVCSCCRPVTLSLDIARWSPGRVAFTPVTAGDGQAPAGVSGRLTSEAADLPHCG